jgi:predicted nucleotidyltransferase
MNDMTRSKLLQQHREAIRDAVRRHRATNPRVFGSVARQEDREGSDLDLLVDPLPQTTLFDLGGLQEELEELLGVHVDVRVPGDLPVRVRTEVLVHARPL